ncbi:MAG: response regulator [Verrucomicrobiota bacterium]|nr:response regulator [Verrucomicrobiota bacterium]
MTRAPFHVFVVEDHPATARGLKIFLELAGYTVTVAHDIRSALHIAERSPFDVMVCDLHLPDGTGWDLMEKLRKKIPVRGIAFSAFDEPEHLERSKAVGFDEHVIKGTTPETLLAAIDRIARLQSPVAQPAAPVARRVAALDGAMQRAASKTKARTSKAKLPN